MKQSLIGQEWEIGGARWKAISEICKGVLAERIDEGTGKGKQLVFAKDAIEVFLAKGKKVED